MADEPTLPTQAQKSVSSADEIDALCDPLAASTKGSARPRLFATISEEGKPAPTPWQEFTNAKRLHRRLQILGTYEVAEVWAGIDGSLYVRTTATSDTGDWARFVHYCYRPDRTLARSKFIVNRFGEEAGVQGTRVRHFAPDGSEIRTKSETRDLETGKRRAQRDFDEHESIYKTVEALPFARLLLPD